jgi:hypothetical protein
VKPSDRKGSPNRSGVRKPPPPRHRRSSRDERPDIIRIFASELRIGDQVVGTYEERIPDEKNGGFNHFLKTRSGPAIFYGTGLLDYQLSDATAGERVEITYQGRARLPTADDPNRWSHQFRTFFPDRARRGEE